MRTSILLNNLVSKPFDTRQFFLDLLKAEPWDWPPHESNPFQDVKFAAK